MDPYSNPTPDPAIFVNCLQNSKFFSKRGNSTFKSKSYFLSGRTCLEKIVPLYLPIFLWNIWSVHEPIWIWLQKLVYRYFFIFYAVFRISIRTKWIRADLRSPWSGSGAMKMTKKKCSTLILISNFSPTESKFSFSIKDWIYKILRKEKKFKNSTQFESGSESGSAMLRLSGSVLTPRNWITGLFISMLHTFYFLLSVCVESPVAWIRYQKSSGNRMSSNPEPIMAAVIT